MVMQQHLTIWQILIVKTKSSLYLYLHWIAMQSSNLIIEMLQRLRFHMCAYVLQQVATCTSVSSSTQLCLTIFLSFPCIEWPCPAGGHWLCSNLSYYLYGKVMFLNFPFAITILTKVGKRDGCDCMTILPEAWPLLWTVFNSRHWKRRRGRRQWWKWKMRRKWGWWLRVKCGWINQLL